MLVKWDDQSPHFGQSYSGHITWWRDDHLGGIKRERSVRHGHSRDRGQRRVETLERNHRAAPQAVLCVMCHAPRRHTVASAG